MHKYNKSITFDPILDQSCINGGYGFYRYYFEAMQDKVYEYFINPNDDRVHIASGWVDKRLNNLDGAITDIRAGGGGGGYINYQAINGHTTKKINELEEKLSPKLEQINSKSIDLQPILDKIDSIEIPETILEEKEAKKAIKLIQNVDKKLTNYIQQEMSEKEELGKLTNEFAKLEIEEAKREKEREIEHKKRMEEEKKKEEEEDEEIEKKLEEMFEKLDEEEKEEKKKELEKELEETLKEAEEIKKELNNL